MRSPRQIVLLGVALAAIAAALAGCVGAAAQAQSGSQLASQSDSGAVDGKLQRETLHLAASGFERIGGDVVAAARKDEPSVFPVELEVGVTYAVVGACGEGCGHVEVALFDPALSLLTRSPETSDVVIVTGPAQQAGVHGIALSAPGCRAAACPVGFVLLRHAPLAGPAEASAAPAAPASAQISAAPVPPPPSPAVPATPAAEPESVQVLDELAKLAVMAREAARARERRAAPVAAPAATDAQSAPGRPSAKSAAPKPAADIQRTPRPVGQSSQANCQQVGQQYMAAVQTAGAPGTMPELFRLYQYLQCNCGYPPSPQVPPCSR